MPAMAPSGHLPMSEPSPKSGDKKRKKRRREEDKKKEEKDDFFFPPQFFSGCNPVDISWEHRAFFDVGDAEEAGGDALQADGEAAVRGHAVA